jgi:hypothetical protein
MNNQMGESDESQTYNNSRDFGYSHARLSCFELRRGPFVHPASKSPKGGRKATDVSVEQ